MRSTFNFLRSATTVWGAGRRRQLEIGHIAALRPLDTRYPILNIRPKHLPQHHDSELLIAIALGDRRALETLYSGYYERLAKFLSRSISRNENIEEIINDTFMVVWQNAKEFRAAPQVSTRIIGIAYRIAIESVQRQQKIASTQRVADLPVRVADLTRDVEVLDWLGHGMNQLPLEERLTVELAYNIGHSLEDIAIITDSPRETVEARMAHACEQLRRYFPELANGGLQRLALDGKIPRNGGVVAS
jgi:RNA polymerase sigma-70 factor, ECF subfamily